MTFDSTYEKVGLGAGLELVVCLDVVTFEIVEDLEDVVTFDAVVDEVTEVCLVV
jgi:hypothetical protein